MKIKEVNTNYILFDNGSRITFDHEQDCCETNYADFEQLEDLALEYEFENDLIFEVVPENGFRFGSKGTPMFFIPCYSDQNGYYSSDIDIFYDGRHELMMRLAAGGPTHAKYRRMITVYIWIS